MKNLLNEAVEVFGLDINELNKLNLKKCDYGYRVRYIKNENGDVESKIMDRGFIGLMKNKIGLDGDSIINCFIYGKKTVGFYIDSGIVYANINLKNSADFIVLLYNCIKTQGFEFGGFVDGLPTGVIERKTSQKSLADCINNAKTVDELTCDLGF